MGNICSTETRVLLRAPHEHGIYINSWHSFPELRRIKAPRAGFLDQIKLPHKLERVGSSPRLLSPPARVTGSGGNAMQPCTGALVACYRNITNGLRAVVVRGSVSIRVEKIYTTLNCIQFQRISSRINWSKKTVQFILDAGEEAVAERETMHCKVRPSFLAQWLIRNAQWHFPNFHLIQSPTVYIYYNTFYSTLSPGLPLVRPITIE